MLRARHSTGHGATADPGRWFPGDIWPSSGESRAFTPRVYRAKPPRALARTEDLPESPAALREGPGHTLTREERNEDGGERLTPRGQRYSIHALKGGVSCGGFHQPQAGNLREEGASRRSSALCEGNFVSSAESFVRTQCCGSSWREASSGLPGAGRGFSFTLGHLSSGDPRPRIISKDRS